MARSYLSDQRVGGGRALSTLWAWIVTIFTGGYMLPWAISATRGSRNSAQVFWVNVLFGWTVIGWLIAFVMAFRAHQPAWTR